MERYKSSACIDDVGSHRRPKLSLPVIVEGRYDKSAILGMYDGVVIETAGFGVFNSKERQALIRRIASEKGIVVLTDSDGAGKQIRAFLSGILPPDKIYQVYIPKLEGKEARKHSRSKEGLLGVEGVGGEVLRRVLDKFVLPDDAAHIDVCPVSTARLYADGMSGGDGSQGRRDLLCRELGLPDGMSSKALSAALSVIGEEEYEKALAVLAEL